MATDTAITLTEAARTNKVSAATVLRKMATRMADKETSADQVAAIGRGVTVAPDVMDLFTFGSQGRPSGPSDATLTAYMDANGFTDRADALTRYNRFMDALEAARAAAKAEKVAKAGKPAKARRGKAAA